MRFYDIQIFNPKTGQIVRPVYFDTLGLNSTYTSFVNGQTLPAALNVEIDVVLANYATAEVGSWVRVWGVSLQELSQANDLAFCDIVVYAGMRKGLPLAKPEQSTFPLVQGRIFQAFGNWVGTSMTLDLVLQPATGTLAKTENLTLEWRKGKQLAAAIDAALKTGLPDFKRTIKISDKLVASGDQIGPYGTLTQFASTILTLTQDQQYKGIKPLGGGTYGGVQIGVRGKEIIVYDGTSNVGQKGTIEKPKEIAFEDMIGQPTWIGPNTINFKTVMRTDIGLSDYVKLPQSLALPYVLTTPGAAFSNVPSRSKSIFDGSFIITKAHAFGNFRQADAASWVVSFNAVSTQSSPAIVATDRGTWDVS
jgi:hypothetical protein